MTGVLRAWLLLCALLPAIGMAQDFVVTRGPLGDADFYRLVSCGRPPGGSCRIVPRRWPEELARDLTVTRLPDVEPVGHVLSAQVEAALARAISQINGLGTGVHLRRVPDNSLAPIRLSVRSPAALKLIALGGKTDAAPSGLALIPSVPADRITTAMILISAAIPLTEVNSVVLEELTQALGLVFDIENPDYTRRSIFAQSASGVTVLAGQDAIALRLHYPSSNQAKTDP